jgi:peptidoglycan/LPS O-acetylase OafA/YrhL
MQDFVSERAGATPSSSPRLYYLDWLRVLATLGVFLFHASNVFSGTGFEIANAESSQVILIADLFFFPWGMPLFFLVAGAASQFALRRRTAGQFTRERTLRILVPFFTGTLLLGPLQVFLSWSHRVATGVYDGTYLQFAGERLSYPFPKIMGGLGYHMWFLGFLFCYSLLALPLFIWFKGESGRRFVSRLAAFCERRGAILVFILPIAVVRTVFQPVSPDMQSWGDFFTFGLFFVLGYLLYADERFTRAIRRDWPIVLAVGTVAFLVGTVIGFSVGFDVEKAPTSAGELAIWVVMATCGWCWSAFMLAVAMRYLDRDSRTLRYGQEINLPFFVLHQPVLLAIAYFVVQWDLPVWVKFPFLVLSSFAVLIALIELLVKRVGFLRFLFGMKAPRPTPAPVPAPA